MNVLKLIHRFFWFSSVILIFIMGCQSDPTLTFNKGEHIVIIGNNLASRMMDYPYFETELYLRYPDSLLYIRNFGDGGNTSGFRPHSARPHPWAFPGAESFQNELAKHSDSQGHFEAPDEWLQRHQADLILAFFGYNESFAGEEGLENFKSELNAFVQHTLRQQYNGKSSPKLALLSPIAFEDLSHKYDIPNGIIENQHLEMYASAIKEVAEMNKVYFVDLFAPSKKWYQKYSEDLTIDGFQLNQKGYQVLGAYLADQLFGKVKTKREELREKVHAAVEEKNWMWHNDFKIPNGVHVYGRRYEPFGSENYPSEIEKIRQLTALRDLAIWKTSQGIHFNLDSADQNTKELPEIASNYDPKQHGNAQYLYDSEALNTLKVAPGYQINLFASEVEFPDLANPVQMSFDNKGRLWVATMPSYPHYQPGNSKPNDKIIILEDTNGDGKADKQITFVDGLHLPIGFEIAAEGVYVSQGTHLKLYTDTDGDDRADKVEILLSGFDDHDTHHAISAFVTDPSGAIYMGEGVFLHSNVETPYGPVRATNGGFYRYNPVRKHLERTAQISIPNPWGIAFDEWGQPFFSETSGPDVLWMLPGTILPRYGEYSPKSFNLIEEAHKVRPTSGLEFVSSRHFPEEVQGDLLINNTIGFLGMKQHAVFEKGTGFTTKHRLDLVTGTDRNFRPVDMEFAPDGSLYLIDWHNILIGHMQHNARDPYRDHVHGRVYRITYPSRPLVSPANIHGEDLPTLLNHLKLPEYRTRYRTRRELRGRNPKEVDQALKKWVLTLDKKDPKYEHHLLEGLWVSWGINRINSALLDQLLVSKDHKVRAAAVRAVRYMSHQIPDHLEKLQKSINDPHGRVRLEAIVATSWLPKEKALSLLNTVDTTSLDAWMKATYEAAYAHVSGNSVQQKKKAEEMKVDLSGRDLALYIQGKEIYSRDGFCGTCHQENGKGLPSSFFPPLANTPWVTGNEERLIKIVLKGLMGPIQVDGQNYPGQVPMTPYEGLLNDQEIAAVLTYVRNSFGNKSSSVSPEKVALVRKEIANQKGFYLPSDLIKKHPLEKP
jgi:mono/diheme cytochrome c family protein/glucose/arabinose dehydrogenase